MFELTLLSLKFKFWSTFWINWPQWRLDITSMGCNRFKLRQCLNQPAAELFVLEVCMWYPCMWFLHELDLFYEQYHIYLLIELSRSYILRILRTSWPLGHFYFSCHTYSFYGMSTISHKELNSLWVIFVIFGT